MAKTRPSRRTVGEHVPALYNPRKISKEQDTRLTASMEAFGDLSGVVTNRRTGNTIGGHQRLRHLPADAVPVIEVLFDKPNRQGTTAHGFIEFGDERWSYREVDVDEVTEKAMNLAANKHGGEWDSPKLEDLLRELVTTDLNMDLTGFSEKDLLEILGITEVPAEADQVPPPPSGKAKSKLGEVYQLGRHRLMCGDSTNPEHVALLMGDVTNAPLLHADPPYGMGKEADGVANDNLYGEKLDAFQIAWWRAFRPYMAANASLYIWGTAEDLWRLWFTGGLGASERLTLRNEIVWDKGSGMGMSSEVHRQFATATERCLFIMVGDQQFGNVNAADYWEGWEPIRSYLAGECEKMGWGSKDIHRICGVQMFGHWFTKSQWCMIPENHYLALREASGGKAFLREYGDERQEYDDARLTGEHRALQREFQANRAFFDNTHDTMTDVWNFPRVVGEDRHGHATPKPVAMIARAVKSSAPVDGVVIEPFAGSGTTLIACEHTGRTCYTMELEPEHCDVIRQRYADYVAAVNQ